MVPKSGTFAATFFSSAASSCPRRRCSVARFAASCARSDSSSLAAASKLARCCCSSSRPAWPGQARPWGGLQQGRTGLHGRSGSTRKPPRRPESSVHPSVGLQTAWRSAQWWLLSLQRKSKPSPEHARNLSAHVPSCVTCVCSVADCCAIAIVNSARTATSCRELLQTTKAGCQGRRLPRWPKSLLCAEKGPWRAR